MLDTHGDNSKIKKDLKISKFQVFDTELIKIIKWYNSIKNKNIF